MLTLRSQGRSEERRLVLPPGRHSAGGGSQDTVQLEGAPPASLVLEISAETVVVLSHRAGVTLDARVLGVGERWLFRPGQRMRAWGYEIDRPLSPSAPAVEGTAAIALRILDGDLAGSSLPSLVWLNGVDCGKRHVLADGATCLGRSGAAAAQVRDALASRTHARMVIGNDQGRVVDLSSANGLFVNGERVRGDRALAGGEILRIGDTELLFDAPRRERPLPGPATRVSGTTRDLPASAKRLALMTLASLLGSVACTLLWLSVWA